ncbi:MAG: rRNA maturation RNase YbeY [Dehalococcoidia bacterium]|jgi:rRNA maturation RNase YbeY|nr:rRNA maturation RNase YbeY [Dehalococcoidia bacterium]
MAWEIDVLVDVQDAPVGEDWLQEVAESVLSAVGAQPPLGLSLVLAGDEALQRLNLAYLSREGTTDVMAFSMLEDDAFPTAPGSTPVLGEVFISLPQAARQAKEYGHPLKRELALLVTHGILHMLGYDDQGSVEESRMRREESLILEKLKGLL